MPLRKKGEPTPQGNLSLRPSWLNSSDGWKKDEEAPARCAIYRLGCLGVGPTHCAWPPSRDYQRSRVSGELVRVLSLCAGPVEEEPASGIRRRAFPICDVRIGVRFVSARSHDERDHQRAHRVARESFHGRTHAQVEGKIERTGPTVRYSTQEMTLIRMVRLRLAFSAFPRAHRTLAHAGFINSINQKVI